MSAFDAYYVPPVAAEVAQAFFAQYMQVSVDIYEGGIYKMKPKQERICRFCNKKVPEVSFKTVAHVIPELLGRNKVHSDFECDECNRFFTRYENELANYLGINRAISPTKAKEKTVKFKSPDGKIRVGSDEILGVEGFSIARTDHTDDSLTVDRENGQTTIRFTTPSYIPIYVYKALLRIAFSCLDETEMKNYLGAVRYLMSDDLNDKGKNLNHVCIDQLAVSQGFQSSIPMLFQKINTNANLPTHIFMLYYKKFIFQIFLPLHASDIKRIYNKGTLVMHWAPPLFASEEDALTPVQRTEIDLSGREKVKPPEQQLQFNYKPIKPDDAVVFDAKTGELKPAESFGEISKIMFVSKDVVFKSEDLQKWVQSNEKNNTKE